MLLSVFTRHSSDCKYADDRTYRRCNCPKWIGGQVKKDYFRKSAGTRQWGEAEELRLKLEDALLKGLPPFGPAPRETRASVAFPQVGSPSPEFPAAEVLPPRPKKPRVTVESAVDAYLSQLRRIFTRCCWMNSAIVCLFCFQHAAQARTVTSQCTNPVCTPGKPCAKVRCANPRPCLDCSPPPSGTSCVVGYALGNDANFAGGNVPDVLIESTTTGRSTTLATSGMTGPRQQRWSQ